MKRYLLVALLLSFSSITDGKEPSEPVKPFLFSGQSKIYGQYSNRAGYGQSAPANYLRWSVNSQIALFEIPFQVHFLLSTEQQEFQQSLNTFTFRFDHASFIKSEASKRIPFLASFKTLEMGTTRPEYSPQVLNGIRVQGINATWNPGLFYAAVCYGKAKNSVIYPSDPLEQEFSRDLFFARLGVGKAEENFFALSVMKASDREGSVRFSPQLYTSPADSFRYVWDDGREETYVRSSATWEKTLTPAENYIGNAEMTFSFPDRKFQLGGSASASLFTANTGAMLLELPPALESIARFFQPNISSHIDWAWNAWSKLNLGNTRVAIQSQMTGPGYQSLGTSYIRSDWMEFSGTLMQFFAKKQITFFAFTRTGYDNLTGNKRYRTHTNFASFNLNLRFRNVPYLQLAYNPFRQFNSDTSDPVVNTNDYFSASTGYPYKTGTLRNTTSFSFSAMTGENRFSGISRRMQRSMVRISQNIQFPFSLKMMAGYSYNNILTDKQPVRYHSFQIKGTYGAPGKWSGSLGGKYQMNDRGESKLGFSLQGEFPVFSWGKVQLSVEQNNIDHTLFPDRAFQELIARFALITTW